METDNHEIKDKLIITTQGLIGSKRTKKENNEDDSVYFFCENEKDGIYPVAVRDKNTTKALYWYYVDIETGTFEIE